MPQPGDLAESFWRFSLALYARPGAATALLTLQDRDGLDVNLILFGLWLGAVHGAVLSEGALHDAVAALDPIRRSAILPLRDLRRALKTGPVPELGPRVAAAELAAERMAQARLAALAATLGQGGEDRGAVAEANLAACLGRHRDSPEAAVIRRELASLRRRG
jgi:uncharacterized protein (TIGR02444 family)